MARKVDGPCQQRRRQDATAASPPSTDVSLTVEDGEFVALVGPSGCGKTTTLNLVAGLIPLTAGDIFIGDREVTDLDPKDRDIAMVFQNYALYPNKTVYKNLAFPLQMRKLPKDEIDKKVRDGGRRSSTSSTCSTAGRASSPAASSSASRSAGRWCATRAVFLMDEPLSNLDAKLRVQMRSELKRFHQDLERHHHLRHPRPARSGDHGRQDGGDERRRAAAVRHARPRSSPTRSTPSSRASSAARR